MILPINARRFYYIGILLHDYYDVGAGIGRSQRFRGGLSRCSLRSHVSTVRISGATLPSFRRAVSSSTLSTAQKRSICPVCARQ